MRGVVRLRSLCLYFKSNDIQIEDQDIAQLLTVKFIVVADGN